MKDLSFFLGANTCSGFYSLYEDYLRVTDPDLVWVLKGGAGFGKSSFLRLVANRAKEAGYDVRLIPCSGDPSSLDGVHIPALGAAMFDGTSPHVMEPRLVGQKGLYLDLSQFYRRDLSCPDLEPIDSAYKEHYRRAYHYLAAAGEVEDTIRIPDLAADAIAQRARNFAAREIKRHGPDRGKVTRLFTDAFTCEGRVTLADTRNALCNRLVSLQSAGAESHIFLEPLLETAVSRGWDVVLCPDPLRPQRHKHLLIPALGLGVVSAEGGRRLHLDKTVLGAMSDAERADYREALTTRNALLQKAHHPLRMAKHSHDQLEAAIHSLIDFDGVTAMADAFTARLLKN